MKITVSLTDAKNIVRNQLLHPEFRASTQIEIEGQSTTEPTDFSLHDMVKCVRSFNHKGTQKLEAIKRVREYAAERGVRIGLCDAKNFVESIWIWLTGNQITIRITHMKDYSYGY